MKEFLSRQGIPFTERNVADDPKALEELVAMGYMGTPVTVIGQEHVVGLSRGRLRGALAETRGKRLYEE